VDVARYAELFLTESREHLSVINAALLDLERTDEPAEPIGALFRAVHSLKGMSATLGYTGVAELSHEMESLLDRVRSGEHAVTPEMVDVLLTGADALEAAVERAVAGESTDAVTAPIVERIRALAGARPSPAPAGPTASHWLFLRATECWCACARLRRPTCPESAR
jgi:two-component system chemotaxis sensor kinase CheA